MFLNDLRNRLQPEAIPTLINGTKLHVKKKCAEDTSATNSNKIIIIGLQNRLTNVQSEVKASRDYYLKDISSEIHRIDTILKSKLRKIFGDNDYGISNRERCNWFTDIITKEDCSYRAAMCLRENSWGLCVYGVSHPVLWEQFEISDIDQLTEPEKLNMSFCKT
ncbi:hypothetical protein FQA39_LY06971 [Lamprigera yunnana]|nr:hypothetical protein FQA39_LY06971 [Lamprigera yunnana]